MKTKLYYVSLMCILLFLITCKDAMNAVNAVTDLNLGNGSNPKSNSTGNASSSNAKQEPDTIQLPVAKIQDPAVEKILFNYINYRLSRFTGYTRCYKVYIMNKTSGYNGGNEYLVKFVTSDCFNCKDCQNKCYCEIRGAKITTENPFGDHEAGTDWTTFNTQDQKINCSRIAEFMK